MRIFKFLVLSCFLFSPCVELNAEPALILALFQKMRDKGKYYDALPFFEGKKSKYRIYEKLSNDLDGVVSEKLAIEDTVDFCSDDLMIISLTEEDGDKMYILNKEIIQPSHDVKIKDLGNDSELEVTLKKGVDLETEDVSFFGIIHKKADPDNKFYLYEFMAIFGNLEAINAYTFYIDEKE